MSYPEEVSAYYDRREERDRLESAKGALELERTQEILQRHYRRLPRWSPTSVAVRAVTRSGWPVSATGSSIAT